MDGVKIKSTVIFVLVATIFANCQQFYPQGKPPPSMGRNKFDEFRQQYGKRYKDESEQLYRSLIVQENSDKIDAINGQAAKKYSLSINKFADLTEMQFRSLYGSLYISDATVQKYADLKNQKQKLEKKDCFCKNQFFGNAREIQSQIQKNKYAFENIVAVQRRKKNFIKQAKQKFKQDFDQMAQDKFQNPNQFSQNLAYEQNNFLKDNLKFTDDVIPMFHRRMLASYNVDWTNYTGDVRVQGQCGACYAFAAVQNMQALYTMFTFGFVLELSVQQIIDCANNSLSFGCNGGFLEGPFSYLINNGLSTEFDYPYISGSNPNTVYKCQNKTGYFKIKSYTNLPAGNCLAVKTALQNKPLSVGIASYRLQFYQNGTFTDCDSHLDHAVLLVGYNSVKGWKIKNTWGVEWGMGGYAWIDEVNNCGICQAAIQPKLSYEGEIVPMLSLSKMQVQQYISKLTSFQLQISSLL